MLRYIASRLLQGLFVLFRALHHRLLPGEGDARRAVHYRENVSEEVKAAQRAEFGLDRSIWVQYVAYPWNVVTKGSLSRSMTKGKPVRDIIAQSFPVSLVLGLAALGFAVGIGVPLGVLSAVRRNTWVDWGSMAIAMVGICVPAFTIGPLLQIWVATKIPGLKIAGWGSPQDILLPAITLGLVTAAYIARLTRGGMLDVLNQDYIRTAKAKGLPPSRVITAHALRGGLMPSIAFLGPAFAALISGSFIVETIYAVPGMGQHFVTPPRNATSSCSSASRCSSACSLSS